MAFNNKKDHWAFLEEIEAPMWVDLTLVSKTNYQEIDDDGWFRTTHVYHQCSSQELKAAFAHCSDDGLYLDADMKAPASPKLPTSVSRSRGKHYESEKIGGEDNNLSLNKQHPVKASSGKSSWVNPESREEMYPKLSFMNPKGISRSKHSLVLEKGLNKPKESNFKGPLSREDSVCSSSSAVDKTDESNTSTVTSESDQKPQQRNLEVWSRGFGYTSELLSAIRGLSKSYSTTTRQAYRVGVNGNGRQSRCHNSLSSKSSVGSSSNSNLSYNVKSSKYAFSKQDTRNVGTKYKLKDSIVSKASNVQVKEVMSSPGRGGTNFVAKPSNQEFSKKIQNDSLRTKGLVPHRVDEKRSLTSTATAKQKVTTGRPNNTLAGSGNGNGMGRLSRSQTYSHGVMVRGQKGSKQLVTREGDKTMSAGLKEENIRSSPRKGKHPMNGMQRVYLR